MGGNCIRKNGFTLLEVIISMAIIAIVSVGIYTGYMIMIRQTKDGQVKQAAALEGEKVAEALEAVDFTIGGSSISAGNIAFSNDNTDYVRYLNNDYSDTEADGSKVTENTAKYIESITITPARAVTDTTSEAVKLNDTINNENLGVNKIYISKNVTESQDYISSYSQVDDAIKQIFLSSGNNMELSLYLTPIDNDVLNENIEVKDYTGASLITATKRIGDNLVINFADYKNSDGSLPIGEDIQINVYNQTSSAANIYLEKQTALSVDLENRSGEVNLYNNRAENISKDFIGELYDIKIIITDKNTNNNLFTGYYKKNIN